MTGANQAPQEESDGDALGQARQGHEDVRRPQEPCGRRGGEVDDDGAQGAYGDDGGAGQQVGDQQGRDPRRGPAASTAGGSGQVPAPHLPGADPTHQRTDEEQWGGDVGGALGPDAPPGMDVVDHEGD